MFINWLTDEQNSIHIMEYYSIMKRKTDMDEFQKHAKWKKSDMKNVHCIIPCIWNFQKKQIYRLCYNKEYIWDLFLLAST